MSKDDLSFLFSQIFDDSTVWLTQCSFKYPKLSQKKLYISNTFSYLFLSKTKYPVKFCWPSRAENKHFFCQRSSFFQRDEIVVPVGLFRTIFKIMHKKSVSP